MTATNKTLAEFITAHAITMTVKRVDSNPHMEDMGAGARHWKCVLKCDGRKMNVNFSQGSAHKTEPTIADVLGCLSMDASGYENAKNFEEWASEYGYDTDSRKAEKTFKAVEKQATKLASFLPSESYSELLWETEQE